VIKYNKRIEINITDVDTEIETEHINIFGRLFVYECDIHIFFYASWDSTDNWKLQIFNQKENQWKLSVLFPSKLKLTAWDDGIVMAWISRYIEVLLFLAGEDRNIILLKKGA